MWYPFLFFCRMHCQHVSECNCGAHAHALCEVEFASGISPFLTSRKVIIKLVGAAA